MIIRVLFSMLNLSMVYDEVFLVQKIIRELFQGHHMKFISSYRLILRIQRLRKGGESMRNIIRL